MPSPHLVDAIDRLDPVPYRGEAYRHLAPRWHPLSGGGARIQGGRWNPPESFATLYLALERPTAAAANLGGDEKLALRPTARALLGNLILKAVNEMGLERPRELAHGRKAEAMLAALQARDH